MSPTTLLISTVGTVSRSSMPIGTTMPIRTSVRSFAIVSQDILRLVLLGGTNPSTKHSAYFLQDCLKFFASVDHNILKSLINRRVVDENVLWLINQVIDSFTIGAGPLKGIPLGNLTSQIFANIYLNQLDQFIKHKLKIKYYLRYADDFMILDKNRAYLYRCINTLKQFLSDELKLELHPNKIILRKFKWGIDFCGYIVLPHYRLVRNKTRRRIFKTVLKARISNQSLQSYLGYFRHANSYEVTQELKNRFFLLQFEKGVC